MCGCKDEDVEKICRADFMRRLYEVVLLYDTEFKNKLKLISSNSTTSINKIIHDELSKSLNNLFNSNDGIINDFVLSLLSSSSDIYGRYDYIIPLILSELGVLVNKENVIFKVASLIKKNIK